VRGGGKEEKGRIAEPMKERENLVKLLKGKRRKGSSKRGKAIERREQIFF